MAICLITSQNENKSTNTHTQYITTISCIPFCHVLCHHHKKNEKKKEKNAMPSMFSLARCPSRPKKK